MKLKDVIIVSKTTRYEYEKTNHNVSDTELRKILSARGSDFDRLYERYACHKDAMKIILDAFAKNNIYPVVVRAEQLKNHFAGMDIVLSAGGDGTFLQTASKINDATPVLGVNTDPVRSEGHLCNSRIDSFEDDLESMLDDTHKIRPVSRIKTTIHDGSKSFVLDHYALNEVAIAEERFYKSSYYELSIDGNSYEKQKSSGILVCTGSGSTAWFYNEAKLDPADVKTLLLPNLNVSDSMIKSLTDDYNQSHIFSNDSAKMGYLVRAPIDNGIFNVTKRKGTANIIYVKSRGWDSKLIVDSMTRIDFNDGRLAKMEITDDARLMVVGF
ncbi:hypothetical protein COT47_04865 [Candidatus Woesearchaeota archaeon CG08_land_8_20_14_0_20_43_7]|nr:MAG: hypothetical protein COT47_04865 [Candidatus Woesearchaeota archaeon CG08_land_8_20_14_0_20_43_7]